MHEFLLEFFTEEIPARMQQQAAQALHQLLEKGLTDCRLSFQSLETFVTPRRLGAVVKGLPSHQPDSSEEKKGPAINAPAAAIDGFLKTVQLTLDQCEKRAMPGKGEFYFAMVHHTGRPTLEILPTLIQEVITNLPWEKSMTWGIYQLRWVRPLKQILVLFDGQVIPLTLEDTHILVNNTTRGHRFLAPESFKVQDFQDYKQKLKSAYVLLDPAERSKKIMDDAQGSLRKKGFTLKEDARLLAEVTGLVEWPVVLMGNIDPKFMNLPPEVLTTSMRAHQKYFSVLTQEGTLAPHFIVVSNQEAVDGGDQIIAGNEKVLRARLADALFFWQQDTKAPLEEWAEKLKTQIFHEKLETMHDKTVRVGKLVQDILGMDGPCFKNEVKTPDAVKVAEIYKADLVTGMVGEFPELQGIMGGYYARHQGYSQDVAMAIRDHYQPLGPDAPVPTAPLSILLALADKLDTLAGFLSVGIMPKGSKDPYALRRSALGVIRLLVENNVSLDLVKVLDKAMALYQGAPSPSAVSLLLTFIQERFDVYLKGHGIPHTIIQAVQKTNLIGAYNCAKALEAFKTSPQGPTIIAAMQRVLTSPAFGPSVSLNSFKINPALFRHEAEHHLYAALMDASHKMKGLLQEGDPDYSSAVETLGAFAAPIPAFFDNVMVNDENMDIRHNRYALLHEIKALTLKIADFAVL